MGKRALRIIPFSALYPSLIGIVDGPPKKIVSLCDARPLPVDPGGRGEVRCLSAPTLRSQDRHGPSARSRLSARALDHDIGPVSVRQPQICGGETVACVSCRLAARAPVARNELDVTRIGLPAEIAALVKLMRRRAGARCTMLNSTWITARLSRCACRSTIDRRPASNASCAKGKCRSETASRCVQDRRRST